MLKVDVDQDGNGGGNTTDALRYLIASKGRTVADRKLRGCDQRPNLSDGSQPPMTFQFDSEQNGWLPFTALSGWLMNR